MTADPPTQDPSNRSRVACSDFSVYFLFAVALGRPSRGEGGALDEGRRTVKSVRAQAGDRDRLALGVGALAASAAFGFLSVRFGAATALGTGSALAACGGLRLACIQTPRSRDAMIVGSDA